MKKVLLIVIDSATGWVFEQALAEKRLPHLANLANAGEIRYDSVAVFPSITPAATSSIATGRYPVAHGIAGNYWFDEEDNSLIYYGSDVPAIVNQGLGNFFEDFLVLFNHKRLKSPTIFHTIEAAGRASACLNFLIFHGPHAHDVVIPPLVELLPGVELSKTAYGPTILSLGVLVKPRLPGAEEPLDVAGGPQHKFGFDDENSAVLLRQLIEQRALPDFTLAYFPDYDGACHAKGPWNALPTLEKIDGFLGDLIAAYGGLEAMLADVCIVLSGDHAQCDIVDNEHGGIQLDDMLQGFSVVKVGVPADQMTDDDDLIVCPNLRMAQIYLREAVDNRKERLDEIAAQLLADARIDQAFWRTQLDDGRAEYHVYTRDRGELQFRRANEEETNEEETNKEETNKEETNKEETNKEETNKEETNKEETNKEETNKEETNEETETAADVYNCRWQWTGDLRAIDGHVDGDTITFGDYPNAFERIACFLDLPGSGDLALTAHTGYEFQVRGTSVHTGGGSHAALHRADSLSPLVLAGAPDGVHLPEHPRTVDLMPLCLTVLDITPEHPVGVSHAVVQSQSPNIDETL
ncbi:hypothetical protein GC175_23300 [bacterium]|nr:hypothetical protein [bacterium]